LNLCGFFSRSKWNFTQIAASTPTVYVLYANLIKI
jgi:hypothetical protein